MPVSTKTARLEKKAQDILSRCKVREETGCLIWQEAVDEGGYGYINVDGKHLRIQTVVAHYGQGFSQTQIDNLKKTGVRVSWKCGNTICMRLHPDHLRFTTVPGESRRPEPQYETLVKWWENF